MADPKGSRCGVGFDDVFEQELAYLQQRWRVAYGKDNKRKLAGPADEQTAESAASSSRVKPTTRHKLVGLAFSGGGIRSATINMGIAQALHQRGVLDHVDYMSTVSGGGYVGSSISTAMRRLPDDEEKELFAAGKGEFPYAIESSQAAGTGGDDDDAKAGSPFLTWVRNNSNYMATGGFLDFARIGGVLLRGILVNFLVLLPILLLLAVALSWKYNDQLDEWTALRSWNAAVALETEARAAEAEAAKTTAEGGAAAVRARQAAAEVGATAREAWETAAATGTDEVRVAAARLQAAKKKLQRATSKQGARAEAEARAAVESAQKRQAAAQQRQSTASRLASSRGGSIDAPELMEVKEPALGSFFTLAPFVGGLFVFLALVFPVLIRVYKVYKHGELLETGEESSVGSRSQVEMAFAYTLAAIGVFVLIEALPILIHSFHQLRGAGWRGTMAGAASGSALAAITVAGKVLSRLGGLRQKLILLAVGLLGLVIPLVVMLYVTEGLTYGSWGAIQTFDVWRPFAAPAAAAANSALWLLPGILLIIFFGGGGSALVGWLWKQPSKLRTAVSVIATLAGAFLGYCSIWLLSWLLQAASRGTSWVWAFLSEWWSRLLDALPLWMSQLLGMLPGGPAEMSGGSAGIGPMAYVLGSAAVVFLFCLVAVDVNLTGVLGLYRDRLASAYLIGRRRKRSPDGKLEPGEEMFIEPDLNLADLCGGVPPKAPDKPECTEWAEWARQMAGWQAADLQGEPPAAPGGSEWAAWAVKMAKWRLARGQGEASEPPAKPVGKAEEAEWVEWVERSKGADTVTRYRSKSPYHIVNTSLNLQGSRDPMLRDRNSDFLMFSKYYYGGHRTGYCTTEDMEKVFPQMDLPTAMAISAAAASPNSGRVTNKPLVALMTLFNVRLGYWVPHPGRLCQWLREKGEAFEPLLHHRFSWRIPPWALLREMRSAVNEEDKWVNLSDGGHIENLALYELLRRRCMYIICGDGEADAALTFGGLATLMRYARIDMGIEIEFLLDDVRLDDSGKSHQHAALGIIKYPPLKHGEPPEEGYLLYLKSSFTGNEDETMQEYRAKNPDFPHESTADQFFDEGQFEAYRALGFHIADGLFDPLAKGKRERDWGKFERWFKKLLADLAPRLSAKHSGLQEQLRRIQELLMQPEYQGYFYDLDRDLGPAPKAQGGPGASDAGEDGNQTSLPKQVYLVDLQVTLMEDAFLSLNLDQPVNWNHPGNAGWRKLFSNWSKSEAFRNGYLLVIDRHSGRFQNFCERTLDLPPADWKKQIDQALAGA